MVRIIVGAVIGLCAGSIALVVCSSLSPNASALDSNPHYFALVMFIGGGPFAAVGAVLGAVSTIVKAIERDEPRSRSPLITPVLSAIAGFVWGGMAFVLVWAINTDGRWWDQGWQANTLFAFWGGGPFAAIGALLGGTSTILRAMRDKERQRELRHLSETGSHLAQKNLTK
jgi:hypothetical protein